MTKMKLRAMTVALMIMSLCGAGVMAASDAPACEKELPALSSMHRTASETAVKPPIKSPEKPPIKSSDRLTGVYCWYCEHTGRYYIDEEDAYNDQPYAEAEIYNAWELMNQDTTYVPDESHRWCSTRTGLCYASKGAALDITIAMGGTASEVIDVSEYIKK